MVARGQAVHSRQQQERRVLLVQEQRVRCLLRQPPR